MKESSYQNLKRLLKEERAAKNALMKEAIDDIDTLIHDMQDADKVVVKWVIRKANRKIRADIEKQLFLGNPHKSNN